MKLSLVIACTIAAFLIADVNSQFLPGLGLGLGFPGLGFPFFGGLGFGGLGGFGLFGRGLLGGGLIGRRFLGKRDVENQITQIESEKAIAENRTICSISSQSNMLSCKGPKLEHNVDCEVISTLGGGRLEDVKLRVDNLTLRPELINNIGVFKIVGKNDQEEVTFVDPVDKKSHLLFLFAEQVVKKHGFIVRDRECYAQVVKLAATVVPEKFNLVLALNK